MAGNGIIDLNDDDFVGLGLVPDRFVSLRRVPVTGSTNADLLSAAEAGAASGSVLVADHQTAGRGRQRRTWLNEPGRSLLVSVLLRPRPDLVALSSLIAGLAVVDLIECLSSAPSEPLAGLKWPNDVLVPAAGERKLAGILVEATTGGTSPDAGGGAQPGPALAVVVGTGINLAPIDTGQELTANAVSLAEVLALDRPRTSGADPRQLPNRDAVLGQYLRCLDRCLGEAESNGPGAVLDRYRSRCLTLGRRVRFETPSAIVEGLAAEIASDGALVLETPTGRQTLHAGDAHHVAPSDGHPS